MPLLGDIESQVSWRHIGTLKVQLGLFSSQMNCTKKTIISFAATALH